MSKQQRETIDQMLRHGALDFGGDVDEQRRVFADLLSAIPLTGDVRTEEAALGDVPVVTITVDGTTPTGTILYFHGGAYALGSAALSARLASERTAFQSRWRSHPTSRTCSSGSPACSTKPTRPSRRPASSSAPTSTACNARPASAQRLVILRGEAA